ncbi:MAG: hypothetical protein HIU82_02820 [Proteobacteria bacterium]|nr:hypothetical protein [Pseudomonadota bacterium]
MLPGFFRAAGIDVVAEWRRFQAACPDQGADTLAALVGLAHWGAQEIPHADRLAARGLFCRRIADWGVFYTLGGACNDLWEITVLHVSRCDRTEFDAAGREALRRRALRWDQENAR